MRPTLAFILCLALRVTAMPTARTGLQTRTSTDIITARAVDHASGQAMTMRIRDLSEQDEEDNTSEEEDADHDPDTTGDDVLVNIDVPEGAIHEDDELLDPDVFTERRRMERKSWPSVVSVRPRVYRGYSRDHSGEQQDAAASAALSIIYEYDLSQASFYLLGCSDDLPDSVETAYSLPIPSSPADQATICASIAQENREETFQLDGNGRCYLGVSTRFGQTSRCLGSSPGSMAVYAA